MKCYKTKVDYLEISHPMNLLEAGAGERGRDPSNPRAVFCGVKIFVDRRCGVRSASVSRNVCRSSPRNLHAEVMTTPRAL